jgi:hypothetical protein
LLSICFIGGTFTRQRASRDTSSHADLRRRTNGERKEQNCTADTKFEIHFDYSPTRLIEQPNAFALVFAIAFSRQCGVERDSQLVMSVIAFPLLSLSIAP